MDLQKRRELTAKAIELSPSEIVLNRREREPDGAGGWLPEQDIALSPQTFRVYLGSSSSQDIVKDGGTLQINNREMLCPWDADVKIKDTFKLDGVNHRVAVVNPVRYLGEIVSLQCIIEEVV